MLRLAGTFAAKINENRHPLHVSLNNSVNRPSSNRIIEGNLQGERPLTTGGGTKNLGKIDLAFLAIPPIKRKYLEFGDPNHKRVLGLSDPPTDLLVPPLP